MDHGLSKYTNERCRCEICRAAWATYMREYRRSEEPRLKHAARQIASHAVKMGRLGAEPCEVCGNINVQMHHDDYLQPLEVRWLCREHHRQAEKKTGTRSGGVGPLTRTAV